MDAERFRRVNMRLSEAEAMRLAKVFDIAETKTLNCAPLSRVMRELIGFRRFKVVDAKLRETLLLEEEEVEKKGRKRRAM